MATPRPETRVQRELWHSDTLSLCLNGYGATRDRPHAHDYSNISLILSGSLHERVGRNRVSAEALDTVAKPATTEHETHYGPSGAVLLQLKAAPHATVLTDSDGKALPYRWFRNPKVATALLRLGMAAMRSPTRPPELESLAFDVVGALLGAPRRGAGDRTWLRRVRRQLDEMVTGPVRVSALAAAAGVHPVYLTRRFRESYGCSIAAYIRHRRIAMVTQLLRDTRLPLAMVAARAGFADQSHLNRIFRAATGQTPATFRSLNVLV